jgi:hypothetical protein
MNGLGRGCGLKPCLIFAKRLKKLHLQNSTSLAGVPE